MNQSIINFKLIFIQTLFIFFFLSNSINTLQDGKIIGAYVSTPDASKLQYRSGNGIGGIGNDWDDGRLSNLSSWGGCDGQRKKLPEYHLEYWGYGIEIGDCQTNTKCGILDVVGYLCGPSKAHSSNRLTPYENNKENQPPANLYKQIWLSNGKINPENYWAVYINETVSRYKDHIKIWEVWNEPDYTKNYGVISKWKTEPPNQNDLPSWHGSIFEYIRLLRITYEVAKKIDPTCWIATGGLGYTSFLDAILRYTDNPADGSVTDEYPALGGAYFDCDAYHQYPQYGVTDEETGEGYNDNGSDSLAKKVVILKKNHQYTIKKYGFGVKYPAKIFINTETGYENGETKEANQVRRNWIAKLALYQIEYDVKQIHSLYLHDSGIKGMGDFQNIGKFVSVEEGYKHIKDSSKVRVILKRLNIGKYEFDQSNSKTFRASLPEGMSGIVLKRKFPKVDNETYYSDYIYSIWLTCIKADNQTTINFKPNIPFKPRRIDWKGNEKNFTSVPKLPITTTPIFLLKNFDGKEGEKKGEFEEFFEEDDDDDGTSGFVIFLAVVGIILLVAIVIIGALYCYKKFVQKKNVPLDKHFFTSLLP